jgi:hypothetical protein
VLFDEWSLRGAANSAGLTVKELRHTQGAPFWAVNIADGFERLGWVVRSPGQSIADLWTYRAALAPAALFDFARSPFARTSQMFAVLESRPV